MESSEFDGEADVDLTACEVVGNGKLVGGDVGYPVVGVDVGDVENVEGIKTDPDVTEG